MTELYNEMCVPCRSGGVPLSPSEIDSLSTRLPAWSIADRDSTPKLRRTFRVADFAAALDFANRIGAIAEEADHHPRITLEWGSVTVSWWTHMIKGLHRNDFIMAARTERILSG
ncbi:MAG: 4a-hydroxytetrahydrobiopterin dehydratase [Spirochaetaceae bacterium]